MSHHPTLLGIQIIFGQLAAVLESLTDDELSSKTESLFGASVGQHMRHIADMFLQLNLGYANGIVDYEKRERNTAYESHVGEALHILEQIKQEANKEEKDLLLKIQHSADGATLKTSYYRELHYCFEHAIHHMALIRSTLKLFPHVELPSHFGVAFSTIEYQVSQK